MTLKMKITETIGNGVTIREKINKFTLADYEIGLRQMLEASSSRTLTATDDVVLTDSSTVIQLIDPGGADRDVELPAEGVSNHGFLIINTADADETITVKNDAGTIVGYVGRGGTGWFVSNGVTWYASWSGSITANPVCEGRLTLETGVPISITDQADKITLYFMPYKGNRIALYNGSAWVEQAFTEKSLDISGFTASKPYDIFINDDGGLALSGVVWTDATNRATALDIVDGIYVKTGDSSYRYLGTIYIDSAQKCQDTVLKRFVWNYYNRIRYADFSEDSTNSWTINSALWVTANGGNANWIHKFVTGVCEYQVRADAKMQTLATNTPYISIGLDGANPVGLYEGNVNTVAMRLRASYTAFISVGYHTLQAIILNNGGGNSTFYGDTGGGKGGMIVEGEK
jgi:hypothetical protein